MSLLGIAIPERGCVVNGWTVLGRTFQTEARRIAPGKKLFGVEECLVNEINWVGGIPDPERAP